MTTTDQKPHPFRPDVAGIKCAEIRYPQWLRCGEPVSSPAHTGTRAAPPELEFPTPRCSLCDEETYYDAGFRCDRCGAHWSTNGGDGGWDDPDAKRCPVVHKPFDRRDLAPEHERIRHHIDHCVLPEHHAGDHRKDAYSIWPNEEEA